SCEGADLLEPAPVGGLEGRHSPELTIERVVEDAAPERVPVNILDKLREQANGVEACRPVSRRRRDESRLEYGLGSARGRNACAGADRRIYPRNGGHLREQPQPPPLVLVAHDHRQPRVVTALVDSIPGPIPGLVLIELGLAHAPTVAYIDAALHEHS